MASKSCNLQQLPKIKEVLECFRARPGHVLVDSDFASIEPKVIATFSRDATYRELYAAGKPHDPYLFIAAELFPEQHSKINAVYNLTNPTKESVAVAKQQFKKERTIAKLVTLSCGYGASARKIYQSLRLAGMQITQDEVTLLRHRYWELFSGIRRWERELKLEREHRGGWVYNAHGRPLSIPEHRVKDLVNSWAQSSSHDALLTFVWYLDKFRQERCVPMTPWIPDWHDQTIWQTPEASAVAAMQIFKDAYTALNKDLCAEIPITGDIQVVMNLWDAKK